MSWCSRRRSTLAERPELCALAERLGILLTYRTQDGARREIASGVLERLCAALGHPAASEAEAARSRGELAAARQARPLPREAMRFAGEKAALRLPGQAPVRFELGLRDEAGRRRELGGRIEPVRAMLQIPLPVLGLGAHELTLRLDDGSGARELTQTLWVAPLRCPTARQRLGSRRAFGLWGNLYAVRGEGGVGVGHLGDLRALVRLTATAGGDFVGLNPLHAVRNRGGDVSPYAPVSRLFRNPLYLDVAAVPELATSPAAQRLLTSRGVERELAALRAARQIDWERSARLLARLWALLHAAFRAHASTARRRAFAAYRAREGEALADFATFQVLEEVQAARGAPRDWRRWPPALRDARSAAVAGFRRRHALAIERAAFAQFELDRQLGLAAREARRRGLAVGLYTDLAIGSAPSGFDAWAFGRHFVPSVEVGAPPDRYSRRGQAWGFPPLDPGRLLDGGLGFVARLLRANLRHAGALRIDHILGFFRQWWVPVGTGPAKGAYVRFPARALLGILALEAHRAGALVIGEDLGTVPPEVPAALARHGVLSSRVMLFERDRGGSFRSARRYSKRALVTANTHDLPTLAGWFGGRDLEIRQTLGLLGGAAARRAWQERAGDRDRLLGRLRREGHLPREGSPLRGDHRPRGGPFPGQGQRPRSGPAARGSDRPTPAALLAAVNRFLCATPAPLVGIALDDLAFETEPVNVPGVGADRYPSWRRRLRVPIASLAQRPDTREALAGARARARRPPR